ncbi:hypothetical protein GIB67_023122 [Kingdonia uniflora]|uniref:Uncharacterized protein n=1 Tax=Kingdonia uniflora TaxID=39325 RepID=A0A7J7M5L5_9MAGN|nr:hypothetical protein GIB67_023122 [Kingdonia uniflora]
MNQMGRLKGFICFISCPWSLEVVLVEDTNKMEISGQKVRQVPHWNINGYTTTGLKVYKLDQIGLGLYNWVEMKNLCGQTMILDINSYCPGLSYLLCDLGVFDIQEGRLEEPNPLKEFINILPPSIWVQPTLQGVCN